MPQISDRMFLFGLEPVRRALRWLIAKRFAKASATVQQVENFAIVDDSLSCDALSQGSRGDVSPMEHRIICSRRVCRCSGTYADKVVLLGVFMTCEKASLGGGETGRRLECRQLWSGESSSPLSASLGSPRRRNKICLSARQQAIGTFSDSSQRAAGGGGERGATSRNVLSILILLIWIRRDAGESAETVRHDLVGAIIEIGRDSVSTFAGLSRPACSGQSAKHAAHQAGVNVDVLAETFVVLHRWVTGCAAVVVGAVQHPSCLAHKPRWTCPAFVESVFDLRCPPSN